MEHLSKEAREKKWKLFINLNIYYACTVPPQENKTKLFNIAFQIESVA